MKIKNKISFMFIGTIILVLMLCSKADAVSASLSASSTNVNVGTPVTITTRINGAAWQINVSGAVSGSYADNTDDAEDTSITKTLSFTPSSAGTYTVKLSGNVTGSNDSSATNVSDSITINVTEKEPEPAAEPTPEPAAEPTPESEPEPTQPSEPVSEPISKPEQPQAETKKSSNANLNNLGIRPNDFKGFRPGTTSYSVTVPNNVERVEVYASLQDSKSKITSGTGYQNLNIGDNNLNVVVTAEDGTQKTYTIKVTRKETANEENNEEEKNNEENNKEENSNEEGSGNETTAVEGDLIKLSIKGYALTPAFSPNIYEYRLNLKDDINSLDIIAEGANHNINIEIAGDKEIKDGENIITVLVTNEETKQNSTYQIIVNKNTTNVADLNKNLNNAMNKAKKIRYAIFGVIGAIVLGLVIFFIVMHKKSSEENTDIYEYDSEDQEVIDLNEDEELFKRVNKEKFNKKNDENNKIEKNNSSLKDKLINQNEGKSIQENTDERNTIEQKLDDINLLDEHFKNSKSDKKGRHF